VKAAFLETISLIERLHRQCLEVVKAELDRIGVRDLNNVQALILFNIGKEELTVGELTQRGYYLGSNVSYNVRKMVENGYLTQERSTHDRRSVRVRLSDKGLDLCNKVGELHERHIAQLADSPFGPEQLAAVNQALHYVERFWTDAITFGARMPADLPRTGTG
jgi:DNA-binding MarR family transcriptional regulator